MKTRNWVFNLLNPSKEQEEKPIPLEQVKYLIWTKEKEEDLLYLEAYVEFKSSKSLSTVKNYCPSANWQPRIRSDEETRNSLLFAKEKIEGPWEYGSFKKKGEQGKRTDLLEEKKEKKEKKEATAEDMLQRIILLEEKNKKEKEKKKEEREKKKKEILDLNLWENVETWGILQKEKQIDLKKRKLELTFNIQNVENLNINK